MFNQNNINPFIDQVVLTIDSMFENKDVPQSLRDYLYLICTGMVLNYGYDFINDIYESIKKTRFIYGLKSIEDKLTKEEYKNLLDRFNNSDNAYSISTVSSKDNKLNIKYTIIIAKDRNNKQQLLEYLTHELNHILTSINKTFTYNKDNIYFRYGLFTTNLKSNNKKENGKIFNEIINTLETEDIINQIIKLRKDKITNTKFNNALRILDRVKTKYTATGYEPFVNLYRSLYRKKDIKNLINQAMLDGNIDKIEKEFNSKLNNTSYKEMISLLDNLYANYELTKQRGMEKAYETSSQYLDFKNNIIYVLIDYKPDLA